MTAKVESGGLPGLEDEISLHILRSLPLLEAEMPGFSHQIAGKPFIRTRGMFHFLLIPWRSSNHL